ncbi:hypothetical protein [Cesiribacter andamanensis]|uniref:Uncharacterized protein n=1 Tax=Cesiribacter andamanensis AMV16 TaxID=1279009 RepID=M7NLG1_9BACT|nr:hypothetical protein [Cesiribacter andamanensis]EMR02625.1 hypothetical protein ADICEAN_02224 [Cesiribacter andamanensis AMV16]
MRKRFLLLAVCWLAVAPLQAQFISVQDLHFPAGVAHQQLSANELLMTYSLKPDKEHTSLRTVLYDTLLQVSQTFQTKLPFEFKVLKVSKAGNYYAHLLMPRGKAKEALLVITDQAGTITGQHSLSGRWGGLHNIHQHATQLYGDTQDPAFYLIFSEHKKQFTVLKLLQEGTMAWEYTSPIERRIVPGLHVRGDRLFVFAQESLSLRKHQEKVVVLNAHTDQVASSFSPGSAAETITTNRLSISATGDTLTFIGRSYPGRKLDNHTSGSLYLARYNAQGEQLEERQLANGQKRIYWHDVVEADGKLYAVGETFRTTTFGEHMLVGVATGLLTLGTLYISKATLTTRDVVIRPLDEPSSMQQVLSLPPSRYTISTHLSPFVFADLYGKAGAFRYRGARDGELLLQVKDQAYTIPLAAQDNLQPRPIGQMAPLEYILYSSNRYFIAYISDKSKNEYRLQRFKIHHPVPHVSNTSRR